MTATKANKTTKDRVEVATNGRSHEQGQRPRFAAESDALALQQLAGNQAVGALLNGAPSNDDLPDPTRAVLHTPGQPLDPAVRTEMENRFGHNFGDVAVHTDTQAQESARTAQATAYTVGKDIVFGAGRYLPDTAPGKYLLAHELAHVVQQRRGGPPPNLNPAAAHEQDAHSAASAVAHGEPSVSVGQATGVGMSRNDGQTKPMTAAHAGGEMGERDAAFDLGQKGYEIIVGPGGEKGHKLTTPGFDIVAYHPKTGELRIVDNKASGGTSTVQDASAITKNLKTNLDTTIQKVQQMADFPNKADVLQKLQSARAAIAGNKKLPPDVKLVITNAGGFHSGISKKLKQQGIIFEDVTGKAVRDTRKRDIKKAKKAGVRPGRPTVHTGEQNGAAKPPTPTKPPSEPPKTPSVKPKTPTPKPTAVTPKVPTKAPTKALGKTTGSGGKFRLSTGGRFRGIAGGAAGAIANLILQYFIGKWMAKIEQDLVNEQIKKKQPEIETKLKAALTLQSEELVKLREANPDADIYVNITFELNRYNMVSEGGMIQSMPVVEIGQVGYSLKPWGETPTRVEIVACIQTVEVETLTVSDKIPIKELFEE